MCGCVCDGRGDKESEMVLGGAKVEEVVPLGLLTDSCRRETNAGNKQVDGFEGSLIGLEIIKIVNHLL